MKLPPAQRKDFVQKEARQNSELAQELDLLLSPEFAGEDFLEDPIAKRVADEVVSREVPRLQIGETIGDFVVRQELGSGAFAVVYLADQVSLQRPVALKVSNDTGNEARTIAQIEHDNVVRVFSHFPLEGRRFIVMQLVPGITLQALIDDISELNISIDRESLLGVVRRAVMSAGLGASATVVETEIPEGLDFVDIVLWMGIQLADALDYAHQRGILHLDVKPSNVLLHFSGRPFLTDFNVSLSHKDVINGTAAFLGGTFNYMAPEQRRLFEIAPEQRLKAISAIGPWTDLFALGNLLQNFLSRSRSSGEALFTAMLEARQRTLLDIEPTKNHLRTLKYEDAAAAIDIALKKATEPEIAARFKTGREMAAALRGCLALRRAHREMPGLGPFDAPALRHPVPAFGLAGLVPPALLSLTVGVATGAGPAWLISWLAVLLVAATSGFFVLRPFHRFLITSRKTSEVAQQLRRSGLTWVWGYPLSVGIAFGTISIFAGHIAVLGSVLGLAAGMAGCGWFHLRFLYSHFLLGIAQPLDEASRELGKIGLRMGVSYVGMIFTPLAMAGLIYYGSLSQLSPSEVGKAKQISHVVTKMYQKVLARLPETLEQIEWINRFIAAGEDPTTFSCVFWRFLAESESISRNLAKAPDNIELLKQWYLHYLDRPISQAELDSSFGLFWVDRLASARERIDVLAGLMASGEFTGLSLPVSAVGPSRARCSSTDEGIETVRPATARQWWSIGALVLLAFAGALGAFRLQHKIGRCLFAFAGAKRA